MLVGRVKRDGKVGLEYVCFDCTVLLNGNRVGAICKYL
jgi:hypothetical protein